MAEKLTYHEVYEKYKNLVLKVAYAYSGDYDAAEDIMQNTFLKLYMYFEDMHQGNLKSWLYTTAKHMAINHRKRMNRELFESEAADGSFTMDSIPTRSVEDEFLMSSRDLEIAILHEKIFVEILEKNPRWYEALRLIYMMEVPQKKVADEMGISINVLHSLLHRAKEWIRKEYGVEYHEMNRD